MRRKVKLLLVLCLSFILSLVMFNQISEAATDPSLTFTLTNEDGTPLAGAKFYIEVLRNDRKLWSKFINDDINNRNPQHVGNSEFVTDANGQLKFGKEDMNIFKGWGDNPTQNDLAFRFRQLTVSSNVYISPPAYGGEGDIEETNWQGESLNGFVTQPVVINSETVAQHPTFAVALVNKKTDNSNLLINPDFIQVENGMFIPAWYLYYSNFNAENVKLNPVEITPNSLAGYSNYLAVEKMVDNDNIGPWRLSGSGIIDYTINDVSSSSNLGHFGIFKDWNNVKKTLGMYLSTKADLFTATGSLADGVSANVAQVVNVTPGKTYRFGTKATMTPWEDEAGQLTSDKVSVQIRIYEGQSVQGTTGTNQYFQQLGDTEVYTTYKVPSNVKQLTLVMRVKLKHPMGDALGLLGYFKNSYLEEVDENQGGGGSGGGSGGSGSGGGQTGSAKAVTVNYRKNDASGATLASSVTLNGALGRNANVQVKSFSGWTYDHTEITEGTYKWSTTSNPPNISFTTTAQTVNVIYKENAAVHDYHLRADSPINYGTVDVGTSAPANNYFTGKVYLYDGNTKVKSLTGGTDFSVSYSPSWTSVNQTAGTKNLTTTFRTTSALDSQYPGLSSNDSTTSTLNVTFKAVENPWELKVVPIAQTYKTTDSQPTAANRLTWVETSLVSTAVPPTPGLPASPTSVTITARETTPGSGSYTSTSSVAMSQVGTTKYRVTVVASGLDGGTYTKSNVEVPITIVQPVVAKLKITETTPQTAWTTDPQLTASASWIKAVITENDVEKQVVQNPTVKIIGRETMPNSGIYTVTDAVDMLLVGTTNYRVEVSTSYNGETLTDTGIVSVTIKKLELKADAVGTSAAPIVLSRNTEISDETLRGWVKNVRLEGQLLVGENETIITLMDNDQYSYSVSMKEGESVDTQKVGEQTCTLVITATTNINGNQSFGPIEVPVTVWIAGLGLEVPEELAFNQGKPSVYQSQLLERQQSEWAIEVLDTRQQAQTDWTVDVKLAQNFQTEIESQTREIKDILIYKNQGTDEGHFIDDVNYPIFSGKGDTIKSWDSDAGFLLSISPWKSLNIQQGEYRATLQFTLSDAP